MLQNRTIMAAHLRWCLGDGQACPAYAQPWFQDWLNLPAPTREQKNIKVVSFYDSLTLSWKVSELNMFGGNQIANYILNEHLGYVLQMDTPDRLMFTYATNGEFTVKQAYRMLDQLQPIERHATSHARGRFNLETNLEDKRCRATRQNVFLEGSPRSSTNVCCLVKKN